MALPIFKAEDYSLMQLQTTWSSPLNQLLANPVSNGSLLVNVPLVAGANVINHKLGRKLQGWMIAGMHGAFVQVYDTQSTNQSPQLTLNLNSSGTGSITLFVF